MANCKKNRHILSAFFTVYVPEPFKLISNHIIQFIILPQSICSRTTLSNQKS